MQVSKEHGSWNYGTCEICLKNAGDQIKMVLERVGDAPNEFFVCPECGSTKRL